MMAIGIAGVSGLTVLIGVLVGGNFALAKFVVLSGVAPFTIFYWQILGASILLFAVILIRKQRLPVSPPYLRYYIIGGILGVSAPQVMSYVVLRHVPASLFVMFVALSPLMTFVISSLMSGRLLPRRKLLGILLGLAGVSIATLQAVDGLDASPWWLLLACGVPVLLGVTNIYRERAFPKGGQPLALATGTLLSQATILAPYFVFFRGEFGRTVPAIDMLGVAIGGLAAITALSYILTFELYRRTDGLGFSQVGYFVTLTGVGAGALFFGEALGIRFGAAIVVLFLGLAVTNGHLRLRKIAFRG